MNFPQSWQKPKKCSWRFFFDTKLFSADLELDFDWLAARTGSGESLICFVNSAGSLVSSQRAKLLTCCGSGNVDVCSAYEAMRLELVTNSRWHPKLMGA